MADDGPETSVVNTAKKPKPQSKYIDQDKTQLIADRTHIEEEERMYEVHNADGQFTCKCSLC